VTFRLEKAAKDISISMNTTTSAWFDLEAAIANGDIAALNSVDNADVGRLVRQHLRQENARNPIGAALR